MPEGVPGGCAQGVCPKGVPRGAPRGNLRYHTGSATTNVQPVWVCGCKCSAGSTGVAQGAQGHMHKAGVPTQSKGTTALVQNSCTKLVAGLSQAQGNKNQMPAQQPFFARNLAPPMSNVHTKAWEQANYTCARGVMPRGVCPRGCAQGVYPRGVPKGVHPRGCGCNMISAGTGDSGR